MTTPAASTAEPPLLFDWSAPRGRGLTFLWFLLGSIAAHAICFYLFQIVYPPNAASLPPPARVSVVSPQTDDGKALLRWIEAEDPALTFTTVRPPDAQAFALPKVEHVPSYVRHEPKLKPVPPHPVDLSIPTAQPPGPVSVAQRTRIPRATPSQTTVSFSEEFAALGAPVFPEKNFRATASDPLQAATYRVAVNAAGAIQFCFPVEPSGDATLDAQARKYLALCRFPGRSTVFEGKKLLWGMATIVWGDDVSAPVTSTASAQP